MDVKEGLRKIEILFWKVVVGLMKNQRAFRLTLAFLAVILVCGIFGLAGFLAQSYQSKKSTTLQIDTGRGNKYSSSVSEVGTEADFPRASTQIQNSSDAQNNLLVILVDSLASRPSKLIGIWLVGRSEAAPQIVFLPLFPSFGKAQSDTILELFDIDDAGKPAAGFANFLISENIWWDHYLILDKTSLAEMLELMGGFSKDGRDIGGAELVDSFPDSEKSPEAALDAQAEIANALCRNMPTWIREVDPEILWGLLTHRMRSDLSQKAILAASELFSEPSDEAICDFPTLQVLTLWSGSD